MHLQLSEPPTERDVRCAIEVVLIAEEDHLPLQQRRSDRGDHVVGQWGREVDPGDLGANRGRQRLNLHAPESLERSDSCRLGHTPPVVACRVHEEASLRHRRRRGAVVRGLQQWIAVEHGTLDDDRAEAHRPRSPTGRRLRRSPRSLTSRARAVVTAGSRSRPPGASRCSDPSGTLVPYARGPHGYRTRTNEPYIARADDRAVAGAGCSFVKDTIYALEPSSKPAVIRIDTDGQSRTFARLPAGSPYGIAFDDVGRFGYQLLVTEVVDKHTTVLAIDCNGRITTITANAPVVEGGIAVAPRSFGAFGGDLIAPDEHTGIIWAIDPTGTATKVTQSPLAHGPDIGVESEGFVPSGFTNQWSAYVADRKTPGNPHPGNDAILRLAGADLLAAGVQAGDLLVVSEASADTIVVHCSTRCSVRQIADGPENAHIEGHIVITNTLH